MINIESDKWVWRYDESRRALQIQNPDYPDSPLLIFLGLAMHELVMALLEEARAGGPLTFETWYASRFPGGGEHTAVDRPAFLRDAFASLKTRIIDAAAERIGLDKEELKKDRSWEFWQNIRGVGYQLRDDLVMTEELVITERPAHPGSGLSPLDLTQKASPVEALQKEWQAWTTRFGEDASRAIEEIQDLASVWDGSTPKQGVDAFKRLVAGYIVLVQRTNTGHAKVAEKISRFVGDELPSRDPHALLATQVLDLMAPSCDWLLRQVQRTQSVALDLDLRSFCRAALALLKPLKPNYEQATVANPPWFRYAFRSAEAISRVRPLDTSELLELESLLHESCELLQSSWATEYFASYLEQLARLWPKDHEPEAARLLLQAAVESTEQAISCEARDNQPFAAALFARAAQCFDQVGKPCLALTAFERAARAMTVKERTSVHAVGHYQAAAKIALRLGGKAWQKIADELADGGRQEQRKLEERLCTARERSGKASQVVVILANDLDRDTADWLVDPLVQAGLSPVFRHPRWLAERPEQGSERIQGMVVVGGILSPQGTADYLKNHLYDSPSRNITQDYRGPLTFRRLDAYPTERYVDIWSKDIGGVPTYVLAGLTRADTARAIVAFCANTDDVLQEFVRRLEDQNASSDA